MEMDERRRALADGRLAGFQTAGQVERWLANADAAVAAASQQQWNVMMVEVVLQAGCR